MVRMVRDIGHRAPKTGGAQCTPRTAEQCGRVGAQAAGSPSPTSIRRRCRKSGRRPPAPAATPTAPAPRRAAPAPSRRSRRRPASAARAATAARGGPPSARPTGRRRRPPPSPRRRASASAVSTQARIGSTGPPVNRWTSLRMGIWRLGAHHLVRRLGHRPVHDQPEGALLAVLAQQDDRPHEVRVRQLRHRDRGSSGPATRIVAHDSILPQPDADGPDAAGCQCRRAGPPRHRRSLSRRGTAPRRPRPVTTGAAALCAAFFTPRPGRSSAAASAGVARVADHQRQVAAQVRQRGVRHRAAGDEPVQRLVGPLPQLGGVGAIAAGARLPRRIGRHRRRQVPRAHLLADVAAEEVIAAPRRAARRAPAPRARWSGSRGTRGRRPRARRRSRRSGTRRGTACTRRTGRRPACRARAAGSWPRRPAASTSRSRG